jgi:hypothetical protein
MGFDLFPNKSGLGYMEPVALIGHNVCVKYANDSHYRKVIWFEPIAPFEALDIGVIAAATTSPRTQAVNLQLWRNEFGQFRWFPLDTCQVRIYVPNADGRMQLRNIQVAVDPTIITKDPDLHLTEFYEWEDRNPAFEGTNYTALPIVHCRIQVMGYRFVTEALPSDKITKIQNGDLQCTYIVASGFSGKP